MPQLHPLPLRVQTAVESHASSALHDLSPMQDSMRGQNDGDQNSHLSGNCCKQQGACGSSGSNEGTVA